MIIDSHCHLHDEKFTDDLEPVLRRAHLANINHLITIGCDISTTKMASQLANRFDQIFFSAGFHPHEAKLLDENSIMELKVLAQHKKCVAIGECGLDYYYLHSSVEQQKYSFIKQIELAIELDLPLIIHLRDAFLDCINILKTLLPKKSGVIHCFSGTASQAQAFIDLGCYISLSGIITFKKPGELPLVAQSIPIEKLLVETDCPYLAPHPFRGQRNEPSYITHTLQAIADIRKEDVKLLSQQIYQNTLNFFSLPITQKI
jgi:TatD DNase family protein